MNFHLLLLILKSSCLFLSQVKSKIPGCGPTDPKTINNNGLCYQCSIDVPELLFVTIFPCEKNSLIRNTLFKNVLFN